MITRQLTYSKLSDYLKNLAENHVLLKSFVSFSPQELATEFRRRNGLEYPALVLFSYTGTLDGNKQRTFAERLISFAIVFSVNKKDDFAAQYQAINDAEAIGLSILSRINYDSNISDLPWLRNNFDKNSVRFNEIIATESDNLYGMEFHFKIKVPEPMIIDPTDWNDINTTC